MTNNHNNRSKDESYNIRKIFEQMELDLIRSMKRNLERHTQEEQKQGFNFEQWQSAKLRDLERFRKENEKIIGKYSERTSNLINFTLFETYYNSRNNVSELIKEVDNKYIENVFVKLPEDLHPVENIKMLEGLPTPTDEVFFRLNDDKFNALLETVDDDFNKANTAVLRRMNDMYRQTIFKSQMYYNTGSVGLEKAVDMATKDFLIKGVDAITYSDGKRVNIASYSEMALRTANHRAYLMGEGKKRQENGLSLVVVSAHVTACELCIPWQGKVLIDDVYSGGSQADGNYPLLSTAMEKGLLHPQCRHNLSTYFKGITTLPKIPDMKSAKENYNQEQRQRNIERQIRKYKRLEAGSVDLENQKKYKDKVKEWQKVMRTHLKENPQLKRAYNREQTKGIPYDYSRYDELNGLISKDNITIAGVSQHLKERAVERNVTASSIKDCLENPLKTDKIKVNNLGKSSKKYIGKKATVVINPKTGNIITTYPTSSNKVKKFKELNKDEGKVK